MLVMESRTPQSGTIMLTHRIIGNTLGGTPTQTVYVLSAAQLLGGNLEYDTTGAISGTITVAGVDFTINLSGSVAANEVLFEFIPATSTEGAMIRLQFGTAPDTAASTFVNIFFTGSVPILAAGEEIDIYPADRCVWKFVAGAAGGYDIISADFYPGNAAAVPLGSPRLGVIGKSGRFVPITA